MSQMKGHIAQAGFKVPPLVGGEPRLGRLGQLARQGSAMQTQLVQTVQKWRSMDRSEHFLERQWIKEPGLYLGNNQMQM